MKKLTSKMVVAALIMSSVGCAKMSAEDAIRLQSIQITDAVKSMFVLRPSIPDGDLTRIMVMSGAVYVTPEMILDQPNNDFELRKKAMRRLTTNEKGLTIGNEFGGEVRVIAKDEKLSIVYTKVPANVNCDSIPNVVCKRS